MASFPHSHDTGAFGGVVKRNFSGLWILAATILGSSMAFIDSTGVNVALPIVVDGAGSLEVDLLCADARVAVELDGAQHLADAVAYRRKDRLLQENGYFVLRFLAEDVGKELDMVLDTISSALSRAARK